MEALNTQLLHFFDWLLWASIQSSVLIILIVLLQKVLRGRLGIRWPYLLWLLLLIRLAIPWLPESKISIFNLIPESIQQGRIIEAISESDDVGHLGYYSSMRFTETQETQPEEISESVFIRFVRMVPLLWLVGVLLIAGYVCIRNISLWLTVKRERPITDQDILDLLEDCKMEMGVQTIIGVVVSDKIKSPALFGFVRPRLLLPQGMLESYGLDELRYVFIHELAHLRQRDIYLGWLMALLQIVHWFNPLMWFAFGRMRADRELACDGLAISMMDADEPPKYGRTIVSLLENFSQVRYLPSVAGILEDTCQIERRIKMIADYKKTSRPRWAGAMLLLAVLACVVLTNACVAKADMPTSRFGLTTSVVDGKIYAIGGGKTPYGKYLSTLEVYDPTTDTWTTKADMPTARFFHSTSVVNGKIYAIGGAPYAEASVPTVEEYDPATDTWTRKADMPTSRGSLSTSVVNGKIYAIGGGGGDGAGDRTDLPTVEEYDPATDTWTSKADMPTGRGILSTSVVDGKIYAIGGVAGWMGGPGVSTVEEYDPATDTWTTKADMPTGRKGLSTSVVNGRIYAIGGFTGMVTTFSTVEEYDPATDTWTKKAEMPTARGFSSTSVVNGIIYSIGGSDKCWPWTATSTVEVYEIGFIPADFNRDGIVNIEDLLILIEKWGQNEPLVDIAPLPFGDGIVDVLDLEVLMSYWWQKMEDIVAHWALDETEGVVAHDCINNNGTLYGEPVWQPTGGKFAGALKFDGIDDYVETDFILDPSKGSFSVFAWIKGGAPGQVIISQTDGTGSGAAWLWADSSYGRFITRLMHPPFDPLVSESVITDVQWRHVGLVYDFDGLKRCLYVDGAEVAKDTDVVGGVDSDGGLYLGAGKTLDTASFFSGLIDDVRIYDRALSAEEIAELAR